MLALLVILAQISTKAQPRPSWTSYELIVLVSFGVVTALAVLYLLWRAWTVRHDPTWKEARRSQSS
ncbi:MAG: hypothetical protein SGJ11_05400 [Phycisphaerae bacterium]|nr:hypothetical protein [Phycisphaerae bacterium]